MKNLNELMQNDIFQELTHMQALMDDKDPTFTKGPMTRSPLHVLAFLLLYAASQKKKQIIQQLRNIAETISIYPSVTEQSLHQFIQKINWPDILSDTRLPNIKISVIHPDVFKQACGEFCPALKIALMSSDNRIAVEPISTPQLKVITKIDNHYCWQRAFNIVNRLRQDYFEVPVYSFNVHHLPEPSASKRHIHYGGIAVDYGDRGGEIQLYIVLTKAQGKTDNRFFRALQSRTLVNTGIYDALHNAYPAGADITGTEIAVEIEGQSQFDRTGVRIRQAQSVTMTDGGSLRSPRQPTIITIHDPIIYDPQTGIQVSYSDQAASVLSTNHSEFYVSVNTRDGHALLFLTQKHTPTELFSRFIQPQSAAPLRRIPRMHSMHTFTISDTSESETRTTRNMPF